MVEDASPSFSPDGRWVAFTRKFLDPGRWSPGRQVWLMNNARSELQPLTDEPGTTFSSLAWSPDSRRLAFMRKNIADLSQPSEIWWVDVISGEAVMIVGGGFLPGWIP
jgi:Tol biopolymer transport system component